MGSGSQCFVVNQFLLIGFTWKCTERTVQNATNRRMCSESGFTVSGSMQKPHIAEWLWDSFITHPVLNSSCSYYKWLYWVLALFDCFGCSFWMHLWERHGKDVVMLQMCDGTWRCVWLHVCEELYCEAIPPWMQVLWTCCVPAEDWNYLSVAFTSLTWIMAWVCMEVFFLL